MHEWPPQREKTWQKHCVLSRRNPISNATHLDLLAGPWLATLCSGWSYIQINQSQSVHPTCICQLVTNSPSKHDRVHNSLNQLVEV